MVKIEEKLRSLHITLPVPPKPLGSYTPAIRAGNFIYTSGILPLDKGKLVYVGKIGEELTVEQGAEAARLSLLNGLSAISTITDLNSVKVFRMVGYVSSIPGVYEHSKVLNAASDLLSVLFEDSGRHVRAAVGVNSLPMNSPVEIELAAEITRLKS